MSKNIKLLSAAALAATVITPAMAVEAATPVNQDGVYFVYEGQNTYMTLTELVNNPDMSYYVSELGLDKVTVIQDGEAGTYQDFLSGDQVDLENYNLPAGEYKDSQGNTVELTGDKQVGEVTSVKAINDLKVAKGTATDLKFLVNEKEELTKAEFEEKYEGYTVSFLFNKTTTDGGDTFGKETGKVTVSSAETFKYAVQVVDAEGNKLPETVVAKDFADVTVVDANTVTKVHELGLVTTVEDTDVAWKNPTVTQADKVKIVATVFENGLGTKTTDKDEEGKATAEATALAKNTPTIAKVTSNDPTVAYYDAEGIQVRKDGKVTFTVEFEDKDIEALQTTVEVTTVAKQTATSIEAEDLKVKADAQTEVKFDVLDQNGEKLRTEAKVFVAVKPEGKKEEDATVVTATAGAASTNLIFAKGNNVVTVYGADKEGTAADKEVVLGTFKVEAVDVSDEAKIEKYKLVNNDKDEDGNVKPLDLNIDKDVNNTELKLDVEAYIKDIKVGLKEGVTLVAKSSDAKVVALDTADDKGYTIVNKDQAKVNATAQAAGEAVITLYTKEGDLLTPVATYDVKVNDTTKAITELPFKEGVKHVTVKDSAITQPLLKAAVADAVDVKLDAGEVANGKIAKVEPVKANGIVIVTMAKEYGGKEIVLPALFTSLESLETNVTSATTDKIEAVDETLEVDDIKEETSTATIQVEGKDYTADSLEALKEALEEAKYTVTESGDENANWTVTKEVFNDAKPVAGDDGKFSIKVEEQDYTADSLEDLQGALETANYTVTESGDNSENWTVTKKVFNDTKPVVEITTTYTAEVEETEYKEESLEALQKALEQAGYTVDVSNEGELVVTKAEVPAKTTYTQTVTFTFSDNVTLADDASFELKDADGKVIATEAKATVGTNDENAKKTVTIEIITEDEASPTVATATLEGATVNKILQIIKDEKVEDVTVATED